MYCPKEDPSFFTELGEAIPLDEAPDGGEVSGNLHQV